MESEKSGAAVAAFATGGEADRPIAGLPAAARAVRGLADGGAREIRLLVAEGAPSPATLAEIERLRGTARVALGRGQGPAPLLPTAWEVVRATGKAGDGLVSRLLNRPLSQRLSWLLLGALPGVRPVHVTIFNALIILPMALALLFGGAPGLIVGAVLFQVASLLDGVDGEMARATFRSAPAGATLDSSVDMATNFVFVAGLTIHLALRDHDAIGWLGAWAILLFIVGNALIGRRVRANGAPLGFDLLKRSGRIGGAADAAYRFIQMLTGRDCFAFLFMVLAILGLERIALMIFAGVGTIWFLYVLATSVLPFRKALRGAA